MMVARWISLWASEPYSWICIRVIPRHSPEYWKFPFYFKTKNNRHVFWWIVHFFVTHTYTVHVFSIRKLWLQTCVAWDQQPISLGYQLWNAQSRFKKYVLLSYPFNCPPPPKKLFIEKCIENQSSIAIIISVIFISHTVLQPIMAYYCIWPSCGGVTLIHVPLPQKKKKKKKQRLLQKIYVVMLKKKQFKKLELLLPSEL